MFSTMPPFDDCSYSVTIKCILLLSGIPGAGKSHFAQDFKSFVDTSGEISDDISISNAKILTFDDFEVPQHQWTTDNSDVSTGHLNSYQMGKSQALNALRSELMITAGHDDISGNHNNSVNIASHSSPVLNPRVEVLVVDDTMHLRSMRKQIHRLVEEHNRCDSDSLLIGPPLPPNNSSMSDEDSGNNSVCNNRSARASRAWRDRPYCMLVTVHVMAPLAVALERNSGRCIGKNTTGGGTGGVEIRRALVSDETICRMHRDYESDGIDITVQNPAATGMVAGSPYGGNAVSTATGMVAGSPYGGDAVPTETAVAVSPATTVCDSIAASIPVVAQLISERAAAVLREGHHPLLLPLTGNLREEMVQALQMERQAAIAEAERQRAAQLRNRVSQADLRLRGAVAAIAVAAKEKGDEACREVLPLLPTAKHRTLAWVRSGSGGDGDVDGDGSGDTVTDAVTEHFVQDVLTLVRAARDERDGDITTSSSKCDCDCDSDCEYHYKRSSSSSSSSSCCTCACLKCHLARIALFR